MLLTTRIPQARSPAITNILLPSAPMGTDDRAETLLMVEVFTYSQAPPSNSTAPTSSCRLRLRASTAPPCAPKWHRPARPPAPDLRLFSRRRPPSPWCVHYCYCDTQTSFVGAFNRQGCWAGSCKIPVCTNACRLSTCQTSSTAILSVPRATVAVPAHAQARSRRAHPGAPACRRRPAHPPSPTSAAAPAAILILTLGMWNSFTGDCLCGHVK